MNIFDLDESFIIQEADKLEVDKEAYKKIVNSIFKEIVLKIVKNEEKTDFGLFIAKKNYYKRDKEPSPAQNLTLGLRTKFLVSLFNNFDKTYFDKKDQEKIIGDILNAEPNNFYKTVDNYYRENRSLENKINTKK